MFYEVEVVCTALVDLYVRSCGCSAADICGMTGCRISFAVFFFLMIRRPPRSTLDRSSAASDVYKRQPLGSVARSRQLGLNKAWSGNNVAGIL